MRSRPLRPRPGRYTRTSCSCCWTFTGETLAETSTVAEKFVFTKTRFSFLAAQIIMSIPRLVNWWRTFWWWRFHRGTTTARWAVSCEQHCEGERWRYRSLTLCLCFNPQINDYVVGYHDGTLLFGKVLREKMMSQQNNRRVDKDPLTSNPFGNVIFDGERPLMMIDWDVKHV